MEPIRCGTSCIQMSPTRPFRTQTCLQASFWTSKLQHEARHEIRNSEDKVDTFSNSEPLNGPASSTFSHRQRIGQILLLGFSPNVRAHFNQAAIEIAPDWSSPTALHPDTPWRSLSMSLGPHVTQSSRLKCGLQGTMSIRLRCRSSNSPLTWIRNSWKSMDPS